MLVKVFFQSGFVLGFKLVHRLEEAFTQFAAEDRAVGDVQKLTGFGHIHQSGQFSIAQSIDSRDLVDVGGDVVKFEHIVEVGKRALVHIAIERGIIFSDDGDGDQPAGTGSFEVEV